MSMGRLTSTPACSLSERCKKLVEKFGGMNSGDQILVGILHPNQIRAALNQLRMQAIIMRTRDRCTRPSGFSVPVYLVTFT